MQSRPNNNGEHKMNKVQIYVDNLGDNANFELFERIAERVFGHYASVVVFNFPGVNQRGNIDEEWFSELLADVWDQYVNDPFFSN